MKDKRIIAVIYAISAAIFYAVNTPLSKLLLEYVSPTFLASFLYLGAGIGVGVMYACSWKKEKKENKLTKKELPYVLGMITLDIAAPIFLMFGIKLGNASNASLLGNFEIVATTLMALIIFKEKVSKKLWMAIVLITASSMILSFDGTDGFVFSFGSLFVVLATLCWGLENNCTRKLSDKSTYEIVTLKGICSGAGSFIVALFVNESIPDFKYVCLAMLLGFVAYGLSIFTYIRAQRYLGAAKTSAFYAIAPFIGSGLSLILLKNQFALNYCVAVIIMIIGTVFVVSDTLVPEHSHSRSHIITHTRDGSTRTHIIKRTHNHEHIGNYKKHNHRTHSTFQSSEEHLKVHQKK